MTFEQAITVDAPPEAVFALTQDYARRLAWDPFLRSAELVGPATAAGVGVRAYCVARWGLGMETEYVTFRPPAGGAPAVAAVRMTRGPWMLAGFAGSWRFREVAPGQTRVTFRCQVRGRPRWLARVLDPVLGRVFRWETRRRLEALRAAFARPHRPDDPSAGAIS